LKLYLVLYNQVNFETAANESPSLSYADQQTKSVFVNTEKFFKKCSESDGRCQKIKIKLQSTRIFNFSRLWYIHIVKN